LSMNKIVLEYTTAIFTDKKVGSRK